MNIFLFYFSSLMIIQGMFTLFLMLYAWNDPKKREEYVSPETLIPPEVSFTILIPARHEENVIVQTIKSLEKVVYPSSLWEAYIICEQADVRTIEVVEQTLSQLKKSPIKLLCFEDKKTSKPHALNIGLSKSNHEIIAVFDAEDEPHPNILNIINTVIVTKNADVVQSGVQLMNYNSRWFSLLNVLEYFFWFKSFLQFFSKLGVIPLGGNTVFFKRTALQEIGGWDEQCLTEDADIGIRLSAKKKTIKVIYDELYVTQEETPLTISGFIKQRTRWNQGFLQIWRKGLWMKLPTFHQKIFLLYVLLWPVAQAIFLLYLPISLYLSLVQKVPVGLALYTNIPSYLLALQLATMCVGMWEFSTKFKTKFSPLVPLWVVISFFPYQALLGISALRAFGRYLFSQSSWEKTRHANAHRVSLQTT